LLELIIGSGCPGGKKSKQVFLKIRTKKMKAKGGLEV
jgi:hypothetical protein